jgi:hypothetical protein
MTQMIFVNVPVTDLARTRAFYEGIGFTINPMFSDEKTLCVVVSDVIYLMTLKREFFTTFLNGRPAGEPAKATSALISLSCDSKAAVDAMMAAALKHGGSEPRPAQDLGFMYGRAFCDPDGNWFEPFWMDPAAAARGPPA